MQETQERTKLVIDRDHHTVAAGPTSRVVSQWTDDEVLTEFLFLVYSLRDVPPGTAIPIRRLDVDVLATALELPGDEVDLRLSDLIRTRAEELEARRSRLRRRLVLPVAGIVVAVTAVGAIVMIRDGTTDPAPTPMAPAVETDLIPPLVLERDADGEVHAEVIGEDGAPSSIPIDAIDDVGATDS